MVNWGGGAKGAASGAAVGSAILPGWGTAIGAVGGGLLGLFGGGDDAPAPQPVHLPYFEEDRARLGSMLDGKSAFAGSEWGGLIAQLQQRAAGGGPSVAGNAYKLASEDAQAGLYSMAHGGSAGGARQAMLQAGRIQQGLAQGYGANALQEQQANQAALAQALGQRDTINSTAYQGILQQQLGLSRSEQAGLTGNQQIAMQEQQLQQQNSAGTWAALGGLAAGLGKIYGNGAPPSAPAAEGKPVTSPFDDDPLHRYRRNYSEL